MEPVFFRDPINENSTFLVGVLAHSWALLGVKASEIGDRSQQFGTTKFSWSRNVMEAEVFFFNPFHLPKLLPQFDFSRSEKN